MILTDLNHNMHGNPHPQYGSIEFELGAPQQERGYYLIAEQYFENTLASGSQTQPIAMVGTGLLYGGRTGGLQEIHQVAFTFRVNSSDSFTAYCDSTPLLNANRVNGAIRLVVDKRGNGFVLKVYVKAMGWDNTTFIPQVLDPLEWIVPQVPLFTNKRLNLYERAKDFYNKIGTPTIANPTGTKVINPKSDLSKDVRATKTEDINADDSNLFLVALPNNHYINKIYNGREGQIVTLYGNTANTNTINSMTNIHGDYNTTNILMKDGQQKVLSQNTFRSFKKCGSIWVEI